MHCIFNLKLDQLYNHTTLMCFLCVYLFYFSCLCFVSASPAVPYINTLYNQPSMPMTSAWRPKHQFLIHWNRYTTKLVPKLNTTM